MEDKLFKVILAVIILILIGFGIGEIDRKVEIEIPKPNVTVVSDEKDFADCCGLEKPYDLPFIRIEKVDFAKVNEDFYITYWLGGKLPEKDKLPKFNGDQIKGIVFYMEIDENYFDGKGNVNPGGVDAYLETSFYGKVKEDGKENKINVQGELVKGGPGFDFFTIKYSYNELIFSQSTEIVFEAYSLATSEKHKGGASRYYFKNKKMAVSEEYLGKIKIVFNN
jgi:hypothetical protein